VKIANRWHSRNREIVIPIPPSPGRFTNEAQSHKEDGFASSRFRVRTGSINRYVEFRESGSPCSRERQQVKFTYVGLTKSVLVWTGLPEFHIKSFRTQQLDARRTSCGTLGIKPLEPRRPQVRASACSCKIPKAYFTEETEGRSSLRTPWLICSLSYARGTATSAGPTNPSPCRAAACRHADLPPIWI
jgi:hypothetical protein